MALLRKLLASAKTPAIGNSERTAAHIGTSCASSSANSHRQDIEDAVESARQHDAAGRYADSLALLKPMLAASPNDPDLLLAKASTLFAWGRIHEARETALRSELLGPPRLGLFLLLGWTSFRLGNLGDAEAWMRKARDISPDAWETHFNLAVVLQATKSTREAIASYQKTLMLRTDDFECVIGLGNCCLDLRDAVSAEGYFRSALALQGRRPEAWNHLGVALEQQDRVDEAQEAFERCARLEAESGADVEGFANLAIHLRDNGRTQEALDLFAKNLRRRPSAFGQLSYAHALLKAGRLIEGWGHYEFRWLNDPLLSQRVDYQRPRWTGQDLRGKTILLREEQGYGDIIQFIRYAPSVQALGATVLLRVGGAMQGLARGFPGVDRVLGPNDPTPEFDFHVPLLSLPRVFGTDLGSIPAAVPYLHAERDLVDRWAGRLNARAGLRVGLAWAGSPLHPRDRYRSMSLSTLTPLADVPGVRFISLQKGTPSDEISKISPGFEIMNLGSELDDFRDTAAAISQLDLLICVDTAVAHLAGALGKPVWLMVPTAPDFRWMEGRDDSPWYPAMRLFRQGRIGVWEDVVARIKAELAQRVAQSPDRTNADARVNPVSPSRISFQVSDWATPVDESFSAVAETRIGILQYFPSEPIIGLSVAQYGEYLQPQLDLLARIIQPGSIAVEVSAGVGAHSVALASAIGPEGHLFLYEPRESMQSILRQNLEANAISNVTVMKRALGRSNGAVQYARKEAVAGANTTRKAQVATETLDDLQLERLNWLKIDDGSVALQVLDGAADTLWRLRPAMFIAADDETMLTALKDRVHEFSYRCWRMESSLFNPENFNRRYANIFPGQVALALLAIPEEISADIEFDGCVELR